MKCKRCQKVVGMLESHCRVCGMRLGWLYLSLMSMLWLIVGGALGWVVVLSVRAASNLQRADPRERWWLLGFLLFFVAIALWQMYLMASLRRGDLDR